MTQVQLEDATQFNTASKNKIINYSENSDTGIIPAAIPLLDSANALAFNVMGKSVTVTIDGEFISSDADINTFITEITTDWFDKSWFVSGNTQTKELTRPIGSSYDVKPVTFSWDRNVRIPGKITYQLTLMRAKNLTLAS